MGTALAAEAWVGRGETAARLGRRGMRTRASFKVFRVGGSGRERRCDEHAEGRQPPGAITGALRVKPPVARHSGDRACKNGVKVPSTDSYAQEVPTAVSVPVLNNANPL